MNSWKKMSKVEFKGAKWRDKWGKSWNQLQLVHFDSCTMEMDPFKIQISV